MITTNNIKEYLNIDTADTTYNTVIDNLIKVVKSQLISMLGWNAELHSEDVFFAGNDSTVYNFTIPFVNSINSLSYKSSPLDNSYVTIANTQYTLLNINSVYKVYYESGFTLDLLYKANVTIGYDTTTIPYEIWQVLREMAAIIFKEGNFSDSKSARLGIATLNENIMGVTSSTNFIDLRNRWKKDLQRYRVAVV